MPLRINCPACKTPNTIDDDKHGRKVRCRKCEKPISVPQSPPKKKREEENAIQDSRKVEAASARIKKDDDGDDDRPSPRKPEPAKGGFPVIILAGGIVALLLFCLVGIGGGGALFVFRSKPVAADELQAKVKEDDKKQNEEQVDPKKEDPKKEDPKKEDPKKEPIVADAGKPPAQLEPELMAKVKKATVYLHVTMPSGVTAEGSGFFAIERGIIVTNAHVLGMLLESSKAPKQVHVVQDSGLPTETKMVGELLGVDRVSDLAVIRVPDNGKLPTPLILSGDAAAELQKVYILGFPFGESLGKNITITEQKISSLRPDQIQVDGGMNPGNSGGPVVNTRGNLVGVSVSGITGAQITFAIPAEKVRRLMEGRVTDHQHGDAFVQQGKTQLPVRLTYLDPLNLIREMRVEVWTGLPGAARPATEQKPAAQSGEGPRQEYAVKYAKGLGTSEVPLPPLPGGHVYWVQPVLRSAKGAYWGAAVQTATDFAVLERKAVNLTIDLEKQKDRTTKLESRLTIIETLGKTEKKEVIQTLAETLEVLQEPVMKDGRKTATVRTAYGPVNFVVTINGKNIKFGPNELDAMAIVRTMPPTFVIDDTNATVNFITVFLTPKSPKYYLKDTVQSLNNLVQNPFEATQFKIPNRMVQPQETFAAQSTMAMRASQQQAPPPKGKGPKVPPKMPPPTTYIVDLKMNFTLQGVHTRNGREEATLTVVGTLESRKIKGKTLGDITGKIGFDVAGGFVSSAKLRIFAESEDHVPGVGTFRDTFIQDIDLDRAAGNLKQLALRVDPPRTDPNTKPVGTPVPNAAPQPKAPVGTAGKATVDLIPLIDPGRDPVHGLWFVGDNILHCNHTHLRPRIQIPYQPPAEYDYIVTFSQPKQRNGISLMMPNPHGGSSIWTIASNAGKNYGFHLNGRPDSKPLPNPFMENTAHTTVVQVRRDGVTVLLDGVVLVNHKTDFRDLVNDDKWFKIPNPKLLGLSCDEPTVFHYVQVVEITGAGVKTLAAPGPGPKGKQ
jgi:predicted Zn finger-like uncharacterized protein